MGSACLVLMRAGNVLCCFGGLGVVGGYLEKGVAYLLIAFLLGLALWGLGRLKSPRPKRVRKKR